jgi:hypothetical protein
MCSIIQSLPHNPTPYHRFRLIGKPTKGQFNEDRADNYACSPQMCDLVIHFACMEKQFYPKIVMNSTIKI